MDTTTKTLLRAATEVELRIPTMTAIITLLATMCSIAEMYFIARTTSHVATWLSTPSTAELEIHMMNSHVAMLCHLTTSTARGNTDVMTLTNLDAISTGNTLA